MDETFLMGVRAWLGKTSLAKIYRRIQSNISRPKFSVKTTSQSGQQQNSIVFLSPSTNVPSGGVKVIYNQTAIINGLKGQLAACVLHPLNPAFRCSWFTHEATIRKSLKLDRTHDFVIVPEFWAVPQAKLLHQLGVKYGIYVQNGYSIVFNNGEELDDAYHNAALILGISDDTVQCIKMAFPGSADRVHRVHCSVSSDIFVSNRNKENIICYMPRKLENHSRLVSFFLSKKLPPHWKIESIDGLSEDGVAAIFGKSKIFLSFSELEGLSLPPIEAALSGCHVVGYTGEAAKEYWGDEIFTEIHSGDIKAFVTAVLKKIEELDGKPYVTHTAAIQNLANRYSAQVELEDMKFVSNKVIEILNATVKN